MGQKSATSIPIPKMTCYVRTLTVLLCFDFILKFTAHSIPWNYNLDSTRSALTRIITTKVDNVAKGALDGDRLLESINAIGPGASRSSSELLARWLFGSKGKQWISSFFSRKKKVLILMSDTGGGHRASAQALDQALSDNFPGKFEVKIMDIWTDCANPPFNRFVPVYRFIAKHPILWRAFYVYGKFPISRRFTEIWSWQNSYDQFRTAIRSASPDIVVSVHPLTQLMPISIVREMNRDIERSAAESNSKSKLSIPFVTVVTDLAGAHPTWFDRRADYCFVPSEPVRKLALKNGLKPEKVILRGLPVRPSFWKASKSKDVLRKQLGLNRDVKTVLLMGGGDGVGGLDLITSAVGEKLSKSPRASQIVVVCGHNAAVSDKLKRKSWPSNINVVVKSFVNNIDEYMAASDCLVTKAGPGTIAEAMIRGLPVVLSSFLPGQEADNVPYVVKGGFGVYTGNQPRKIADTVYNFFDDDALLKKMSATAKSLSRPEATAKIARDIGNIALRRVPNFLQQ